MIGVFLGVFLGVLTFFAPALIIAAILYFTLF